MPDLPDFMAAWDFSNPAVSEQRFRALLPAAEATGDDSYRLNLLTQLARAQCLQRHYVEAHGTLDQVVADLAKTTDPTPSVRYLLERGRTHNDQGHAGEARRRFEDAFAAADAAQLHGLAVDALHMLGILDPPEEALHWNRKALDHVAAHPDDPGAQAWINTLHNNLGWTLVRLGRYAEALDIFTALQQSHRAAGRAIPANIARWSAARVLRHLGRVDEALAEQQALLALGPTGFRHEEMAECLLALGRGDEAKPHFAQAYLMLKDDVWLLARGESARIERLGRLARGE